MAMVSWTPRSRRPSIVILGSAFAILASGRPGIAGQIDLTAKAINSPLIVGEPLVLSVKAHADVPVIVPSDLMSGRLPFRVLIDRGSGFTPYVEYAVSQPDDQVGPGRIPAGVTREFVLGFDAAASDWTFPSPGVYRLVVEYQPPQPAGAVRSNIVTVTVQAPTGAEQAVYNQLRQMGPGLVVAHEAEFLGPSLDPLVQQYPGSAYLQERRLRDLEARMADVRSGYEPGHVAEAGTPDYPPPGPDNRPDTMVARAHDLLSVALDLSAIPGPFQPDALLQLGHLYYTAGEPDRGLEVLEGIIREFPDREAASMARGAVGDHAPPTLKLAASPAILWPPNNKLVLVTVTVTVSDDQDPNPAITLAAITCNDACDVAQDIAEATLKTDDRSLQFRARRSGAGAGRIYTITYVAKDASGNSTTARTTVTVPHDQGK